MLKNNSKYHGSILLIAGSTIGAGMLGLPVIVGQVGLALSLGAYSVLWFYMLFSGLMLLEALSWHTHSSDQSPHHKAPHNQFLDAVEKTLGKPMRYGVIFLFMGLFTCLMIAYLDKGGALFLHYTTLLCHRIPFAKAYVPYLTNHPFCGSLLLTLFTGYILTKKNQRIDFANRIGMIVLIFSFLGLMLLCFPLIDTQNLTYIDVQNVPFILPFLITSFGFHNMLPTVVEYNGGFLHHKKIIIKSILYGSAIPLAVYILWTIAVLGIIPADGETGLKSMFRAGKIATEILAYKTSLSFKTCANLFALSAIMTSIFGQGMSITSLLKENYPRTNPKTQTIIFLGFCLMMTYLEPNIFMTALGLAGGIFAILLFGLIPSFMLLKGRKTGFKGDYRMPLPSFMIILFILIGISIFMLEVWHNPLWGVGH